MMKRVYGVCWMIMIFCMCSVEHVVADDNLLVEFNYQGNFYSIQGNILKSDAVVHEAVKAFRAATGSLTDRVMAAMEAADRNGGDSRCSCDNPQNPPVAAKVCTAKTAHVAYILRAEKNDPAGESHNDGKYAFFLSVTDQDIKAGEDANPVRTLRMRYDAAKKAAKIDAST